MNYIKVDNKMLKRFLQVMEDNGEFFCIWR